jgi:hypothetical protein
VKADVRYFGTDIETTRFLPLNQNRRVSGGHALELALFLEAAQTSHRRNPHRRIDDGSNRNCHPGSYSGPPRPAGA